MHKQHLISISDFQKMYFQTGAPTHATVRRWIEKGAIKGRIVHCGDKRTFYVDGPAWERNTGDTDVDEFLSTIN